MKGEYVTLRYDPDHILTLTIYSQTTADSAGEFIGYAHAINRYRDILQSAPLGHEKWAEFPQTDDLHK